MVSIFKIQKKCTGSTSAIIHAFMGFEDGISGKGQLMNTLNSFDIINRCYGELTAIAADHGIDFDKLAQRINFDGSPIKRGIELNKTYRGKVFAVAREWTAPDGNRYPQITFKTFKHGGYQDTWNGYKAYKELAENTTVPKTYQPKKPNAVYQDKADKERADKIKRFSAFQAAFNELPKVTDTGDIGGYLSNKGFSVADIPTSLDLRRGSHQRGLFVAYPLHNSQRQTVGYQLLYDTPFTDYSGKPRNKDFIFYPDTKNGSHAWLGTPSPHCEFIGEGEGLATCLTAWLATSNPIAVCLDADNLGKVHAELSKTYPKLLPLADNDVKADGGNVGLFSAIKAARGGVIAYPVLDGQKVDFDDLRLSKGLEEVARQIAENRLVVPSHSLDYYKLLATYAPIEQLPKILATACFFATKKITTVNELRIHAKALFALRPRHTSIKAIVRQLKKPLKKQLNVISRQNTITDFTGVTCHDMTGKDNAAIAKTILSLDNAIIVDNRPMATGKTELMKLLADYHLNRFGNKASHQDIKQFHFDNGGTAEQWEKIRNNPKLFKALQDQLNQQRLIADHDSQKTVYVCHRVSLTSSASERLQLEFYDNVLPRQNTSSLAVCVNSMPKHEVSKTVKVLFIDEIRQTLEHILNGTVQNRLEVYNELIAAIQAADLVICADADFNDSTLDWLKKIANKPLHAITQQATKTGKKLLELGNSNAVLLHAQESLKKGLNVWIATDSMQQARKADILLNSPDLMDKDTAEALMAELINGSGISEDKVLLVHSENKGDSKQAAFLANPNQESKKYRLVIHTPVISSGISVTNSHFDRVYALFCNVLAPNEMLQTIARVRTAKEVFVSFKSNHPKDRSTNLQDLIDGEMIKRGRFNTDNNALQLDNFDHQRLQYIATRNAALNDYKRYFIILAQLKGYDFEQYDLTPWTIKGLGKAAKEQKIIQISTASDIDATEAAAIDSKSSPTQAETDSLHRYKVTQLTGKSADTVDELDIAFYIDNGLAKLSNFELIHADVMALKASDQANHTTRNKLSSKTSKHYLFQTVINGLEGKRINARGARCICEFLQDHHQELTSNNMGNYAKVSKYPVRQLNNFLKKIGYQLIVDTNSKNTEQWFKAQANPLVKFYAENRAAIKRQKDELVRLAETQ